MQPKCPANGQEGRFDPLTSAPETGTSEVSDFNLKNVNVTALCDGKRIDERFGEAFFTRRGIGGPIILDISRPVRAALGKGQVTLQLDLKPAVCEALFAPRWRMEVSSPPNTLTLRKNTHAHSNSTCRTFILHIALAPILEYIQLLE